MNLTNILNRVMRSDTQRCDIDYTSYFFLNSKDYVGYTATKKYDTLEISVQTGTKSNPESIIIDYNPSTMTVIITGCTMIQWKREYNILYNGILPKTEEDYFMVSTLHDVSSVQLSEFQLIDQIFNKYHRIVRYGK